MLSARHNGITHSNPIPHEIPWLREADGQSDLAAKAGDGNDGSLKLQQVSEGAPPRGMLVWNSRNL